MSNVVTVIFALVSAALAGSLLLCCWLFYAVSKKHPKYYRSIGSPSFYQDYYQLLYYPRVLAGFAVSFRWAVFGVPKGFPKDVSLSRLINIMHYLWLAAALGMILLAALALLAPTSFK